MCSPTPNKVHLERCTCIILNRRKTMPCPCPTWVLQELVQERSGHKPYTVEQSELCPARSMLCNRCLVGTQLACEGLKTHHATWQPWQHCMCRAALENPLRFQSHVHAGQPCHCSILHLCYVLVSDGKMPLCKSVGLSTACHSSSGLGGTMPPKGPQPFPFAGFPSSTAQHLTQLWRPHPSDDMACGLRRANSHRRSPNANNWKERQPLLSTTYANDLRRTRDDEPTGHDGTCHDMISQGMT